MATAAALRRLALALPETEEGAHMGHADFRVRKKIFATLSEDETRANLRLAPDQHESLLASHPDVFLSLGGWSRTGWTGVLLRAVPAGLLADLVAEAWRRRAPPKLAASFDHDPSGATAAPAPRLEATTKRSAKKVAGPKRARGG